MADMTKTIGVLTSGGDAPGMNAAVRAVARAGINEGYNVVGFMRGYNGLIYDETIDINPRTVSDIIHRGGTVLYTARCHEFRNIEGQKKAAEVCKKHNIEELVVIGGDGSFNGALALSKLGVNCICIPGTIDNDIGASEYTIGFDTAVNTVTEMVDKIRDTSQSHDRCSVVEVMGRNNGSIALYAGLATGATSILVPEFEYDFDRDIIERIKSTTRAGKKHFIIIVAEGIGKVNELSFAIEKRLNIESRASILGYVQRGGSPSAHDRIVATEMGYLAVKLLKTHRNRMIVVKDGAVVHLDLNEAIAITKTLDFGMLKIALEVNS